jgi:hypothetical protein
MAGEERGQHLPKAPGVLQPDPSQPTGDPARPRVPTATRIHRRAVQASCGHAVLGAREPAREQRPPCPHRDRHLRLFHLVALTGQQISDVTGGAPAQCRSTRLPGTGAPVTSAIRSPPGGRSTRASAGSPAITDRPDAASATVVAIGPFSPIELQLSPPSSAGTRPNPGLWPTRPHAAAGIRSSPGRRCRARAAPGLRPPRPRCRPTIRHRSVTGPRGYGPSRTPVGERPDGQLGHPGHPDHHRTRRPQLPHHQMIVGLQPRRAGPAAHPHRLARDRHIVLDRHQNTRQRQPRPIRPRVHHSSLGKRRLSANQLEAPRPGSASPIRSRCSPTTSTARARPARTFAAISAAVRPTCT